MHYRTHKLYENLNNFDFALYESITDTGQIKLVLTQQKKYI